MSNVDVADTMEGAGKCYFIITFNCSPNGKQSSNKGLTVAYGRTKTSIFDF